MTYCDGPSFEITQPITKGEFVQIADELTEAFNELYEDENYYVEITPEPIAEGGLLITYYFKDSNNINNICKTAEHWYKSIRFNINAGHYQTFTNIEDWRNSLNPHDDVIMKRTIHYQYSNPFDPATFKTSSCRAIREKNDDFRLRTCLIAFDESPCWHQAELLKVCEVFYKHGICYFDNFPDEKALDSPLIIVDRTSGHPVFNKDYGYVEFDLPILKKDDLKSKLSNFSYDLLAWERKLQITIIYVRHFKSAEAFVDWINNGNINLKSKYHSTEGIFRESERLYWKDLISREIFQQFN